MQSFSICQSYLNKVIFLKSLTVNQKRFISMIQVSISFLQNYRYTPSMLWTIMGKAKWEAEVQKLKEMDTFPQANRKLNKGSNHFLP